MVQSAEFMDVADSDFLSNKELDDDDSEFDCVFEKYFVFSAAKNRFFGRKMPLHAVLGSGKGNSLLLLLHNSIHSFMVMHGKLCKFHSCCKRKNSVISQTRFAKGMIVLLKPA